MEDLKELVNLGVLEEDVQLSGSSQVDAVEVSGRLVAGMYVRPTLGIHALASLQSYFGPYLLL